MNKLTDRKIKHIKTIAEKLTSTNQKELSKIIDSGKASKNTLRYFVLSLLPSYAEVGKELTENDYIHITRAINTAISARCSDKEADDEDEDMFFKEVLNVFTGSFKRHRKATSDLYTRAVKTNLTEDEHDHMTQVMKSYNYRSASAFIRDAVLSELDIKPNCGKEAQKLWGDVVEVSNKINKIKSSEKTSKELAHALVKVNNLLLTTRDLTVNSHSSITAKIIANKHLTARQLKQLYMDKLEQEANLQ